jgi:ribonuclease HII
MVLLDGSHDWLTPPVADPWPAAGAPLQAMLFDVPAVPVPAERRPVRLPELTVRPSVTTLVKADLRCAAVAAASVLAKVERDAVMVACARDHPGYGWHENKGYAAPEHTAALRRLGVCPLHRRSWNLSPAATDAAGEVLQPVCNPMAPVGG